VQDSVCMPRAMQTDAVHRHHGKLPLLLPFSRGSVLPSKVPRMPDACYCFSHARPNESRATGPEAVNRFCPTLPSTLLTRLGKCGEASGFCNWWIQFLKSGDRGTKRQPSLSNFVYFFPRMGRVYNVRSPPTQQQIHSPFLT
jgi:hypothetical protein